MVHELQLVSAYYVHPWKLAAPFLQWLSVVGHSTAVQGNGHMWLAAVCDPPAGNLAHPILQNPLPLCWSYWSYWSVIFSLAAAQGSAQVPRGAPHRPAAASGAPAEDFLIS